MKLKRSLSLLKRAALLLLLLSLDPQPSAFAQGTAFTYQGRLTDNCATTTGNDDLRFTLYDAAGGGSQLGNPITNAPATSIEFTACQNRDLQTPSQ